MNFRAIFSKTIAFFRSQPTLISIILITGLVEATLSASEYSLLPNQRLRGVALDYGAFWVGLLGNWKPNYSIQPTLMFITYAFIHAGPSHFLGNLVTLYFVGSSVLRRISQKQFLVVFLVSALGGAIGFGLLSYQRFAPMVGTSGAIFGVVGVWYYFFRIDDREAERSVFRGIGVLAFLVCMNIAMFYSTEGRLAWETHLGGFVAGYVFALIRLRGNGSTGTNI